MTEDMDGWKLLQNKKTLDVWLVKVEGDRITDMSDFPIPRHQLLSLFPDIESMGVLPPLPEEWGN